MEQVRQKQPIKEGSKSITLIAVMAATIVCGKFSLAFIPYNVEIVTLLVAVFGYMFGRRGVAATIIFVLCDAAMVGFGAWLVSYFIYWPLVAGVFWLLHTLKIKNRIVITSLAVILTAFFGVLSSAIDVAIFMGINKGYIINFAAYYSAGIKFYVIQIVCNLAVFSLAFRPLCEALTKYTHNSRKVDLEPRT